MKDKNTGVKPVTGVLCTLCGTLVFSKYFSYEDSAGVVGGGWRDTQPSTFSAHTLAT